MPVHRPRAERRRPTSRCHFFFFNDTATTEIYTLSLHDALPIYPAIDMPGYLRVAKEAAAVRLTHRVTEDDFLRISRTARSEEHTSELQSLTKLVCRLLLEKKKKENRSMSGRERE